jgi:hypothetical protein
MENEDSIDRNGGGLLGRPRSILDCSACECMNEILIEISSFHRSECEDDSLLGYGAV